MKKDSPQVQAMIKRYGSEEAYRQEMKRRQKLSRENYRGTGGFAALDKTRLQELSRKGVASREKNRQAKLQQDSDNG